MESTNVGRGVGIFPGNGEDGVVMIQPDPKKKTSHKRWADEQLNCFISLISLKEEELNLKRKTHTGDKTTYKKRIEDAWKSIAEEVSKKGERRNIEGCRAQYKRTVEKYKKEKNLMKQTGNFVTKWPFFKSMDKIFGETILAGIDIVPECTQSEIPVEIENETEIVEEVETANTPAPVRNLRKEKPIKRRRTDDFIEELNNQIKVADSMNIEILDTIKEERSHMITLMDMQAEAIEEIKNGNRETIDILKQMVNLLSQNLNKK